MSIPTAYNTSNPDQFNFPMVEISLPDNDIVEAQVFMAETFAGNLFFYGIIGEGYVAPGYDYQFSWDGNLFGLSDGTNESEIFLARWISGGTDSGGTPVPGLYSIPGTLADGTESMDAWLITQDENATVSLVIGDYHDGKKFTVSLDTFRGWQFTPVLYNITTSSWIEATSLTIPDIPNPSLTFIAASAAPGDYHIITTITDVWGNTGRVRDDVTVVTQFGD